MDIKLLGVEFEFGKGITISDLFDKIAANNGNPITLQNYGRFLYIDDLGDYYAGLLITTKNQKKFLEFKNDAKNSRIETKDVTQGSQLADFNYFLINKKTNRGIYQYYHNSCSLNTFGTLCKYYYDTHKEAEIAKAVKIEKDVKLPKIRSRYAGSLKWNILVKPENFKDLISRLSTISYVTVEVTTLAYKNTIFTPMANKAKRISQKFTFPKDSAAAMLVDEISDFAEHPDVASARVEGTDKAGHEQVIKLENTPDSFGSFDYDRIAATMNLSPKDFARSPFMQEIIKAINQRPKLFT